MNFVELTMKSRVVQKKGGIDRIRKLKEMDRLKAAVEIAYELGRGPAKRKCAMGLAEKLMLMRKYGKAKKFSDMHLGELDFLKVVSLANERLICQGEFIASAKLNRRYSFVYGMASSAGLEIRKRIKRIEYRGLKSLAKRYRAERELARYIREEVENLRSMKLNVDANWLARKFEVMA